MKKKLIILLLIAYCLLLIVPPVLADYVLPYPSYMPGNKLYKISRIIDGLKRFWYFGNISQIKYHMGLSDKYLVEAKTLFEYNQYLLGADALTRSDKEFMQVPTNLTGARGEGVDITSFKQTVTEAAATHEAVLSRLLLIVPHTFTWKPEKSSSTELNLGDMIQSSEKLRMTVASESAVF